MALSLEISREAALVCEASGLDSVVDFEFAKDAGDVVFGGSFREETFLRDLRVGLELPDAPEYSHFGGSR